MLLVMMVTRMMVMMLEMGRVGKSHVAGITRAMNAMNAELQLSQHTASGETVLGIPEFPRPKVSRVRLKCHQPKPAEPKEVNMHSRGCMPSRTRTATHTLMHTGKHARTRVHRQTD